jgi:hypothetical protein
LVAAWDTQRTRYRAIGGYGSLGGVGTGCNRAGLGRAGQAKVPLTRDQHLGRLGLTRKHGSKAEVPSRYLQGLAAPGRPAQRAYVVNLNIRQFSACQMQDCVSVL